MPQANGTAISERVSARAKEFDLPYPPAIPPVNRTNATAQADNHPADHNQLAQALTDITNELGSGPKGDAASVTARLANFITVDGVLRDNNSSWGVIEYATSKNGDPAQVIPFLVDTTIQFSTFGPVTAKMQPTRGYRIEGQIGINSNLGGTSYTFSLFRSDVGTGPVMQIAQQVAVPNVVQMPFTWYASVTGAAANVTWTMKCTCNGT